MRTLTSAAILSAALGLSACTNPNTTGGGSIGGDIVGMDGGGAGSVGDPTSVTYFNERVGDRVLFSVDEKTLTDDDRAILSAQADWLISNPEFNAIIEGHADERGTMDYNMALSVSRSNNVREYLISRGVAANRLGTRPLGKLEPLAACSDEACYSQNRRAVTVIRATPGV